MIPTLILFGLVAGRWPAASIIAAAVAWPATLVATGVMEPGLALVGAAALAGANTLAGVAVNRAAAHLLLIGYRGRSRRRPASQA